MSDYVLMLGWDRPARGHEQSALFTFAETVGYLTDLVEKHQIESFEPILLEPHGGDLNGFILVRGETAALRSLMDEEAFQRLIIKVELDVDGFGMIMGTTGQALSDTMARYAEAVRAHAEGAL